MQKQNRSDVKKKVKGVIIILNIAEFVNDLVAKSLEINKRSQGHYNMTCGYQPYLNKAGVQI